MSRLTDLIAQAKAKDASLGNELEREFKVLSSRRSFGLNFERHRPETVELPGRPIRKGDKVHVLPPRGSTSKGDRRLWKVRGFSREEGQRFANLILLGTDECESQSVAVDDLVVVAEFRDYIYPGLVSTGKVARGGDKPFHTVINGENFHALEALTFTHRNKIDVIYIDPPYNTGAKDWTYNNDYVESEDLYRHSKWLAMMERRLKVAKELLNQDCSVLIVTIDEKEYLRLGLLLEQTFPEARMQMVSATISPRGTSRDKEFSRVDEYLFFVFLGKSGPVPRRGLGNEEEVRLPYLRRTSMNSTRDKGRPLQFYPIYVDPNGPRISEIGTPIPRGVDRNSIPQKDGLVIVWPVNPDGIEMTWGMIPETLDRMYKAGYIRISSSNVPHSPFVFAYVTTTAAEKVETGEYLVRGLRPDGTKIVVIPGGRTSMPTTAWRETSHDAGAYGTGLVSALLAGRRFPFPKSLYAVEDALRFFVSNNREAVILDFFSGSGTTAHAVMRLNRQDSGHRQCISITNNEVASDEHKALRGRRLRPGDPDWERWGICEHITKPRIRSAITGRTPKGEPIKGDYKFADEFPMAEGFEENAEFFTLTYETPIAVSHNRAFERIAPLLWMRAGSEGAQINAIPPEGWDVADTYGLLTDLDKAAAFCEGVAAKAGVRVAFIVTDDDRRFQSVARRLPDSVDPVRLYESYLTNFRFAVGR